MTESDNKPTKRLRLVGWKVEPIAMLDDGDELEAIPVAPAAIPLREWEAFKAGGDDQAITLLREQLETTDSNREWEAL